MRSSNATAAAFRWFCRTIAGFARQGIGLKIPLLSICAFSLAACDPETIVDISRNSTVSVKTKNGTIIVHDDGSTEQVSDEDPPPSTTFVKADGTVLPLKFDSVSSFQDGFARVEKDGKFGFINTKGEVVIKPQFEEAFNFSEHLAKVRVEDKYGYIDERGNFIIQPKFAESWDFGEGLAAVKIDDKYGFIDKSGQVAIAPKYQWTGGFTKDKLAAVELDDKYGYIDTKGKLVIPAKFESVDEFSEGLAGVRTVDDSTKPLQKKDTKADSNKDQQDVD